MKIFLPGENFKNGAMELTVLRFAQKENKTLALLIRDDGMFITVKELGIGESPNTWVYGNYWTSIHDALKDFDRRKKEL